MNSQNNETELQESLMSVPGVPGDYKYTPEELASICLQDNSYVVRKEKDDPEEFKNHPDRIISSRMIEENFEGIENIMKKLHVHQKDGINGSRKDLEERRKHFGENRFPPPYIKTLCELVMENFDDPINRVLLVAAVVSLAIGLLQEGFPRGLIEGTSIIIALTIIIVVGSVNNYRSERKLAELVGLAAEQEVRVIRQTGETTIDYQDLVVGDLYRVEPGAKIPADSILLTGDKALVSVEADLNGEPDEKKKVGILGSEKFKDVGSWKPMQGHQCTLLAKATTPEGEGIAMVLAVGPKTVAGVITLAMEEPVDQTTLLQKKLDTVAASIGNVGYMCAYLTVIALIFRIILERLDVLYCGCGNMFTCERDPTCTRYSFDFNLGPNRLWTDLLNTIIIAITVIVVAIPEGLPLAVTISLSFASAKMRQAPNENLVRNLASAETMGGVTHICSDKTGTLTMNKMTTQSCLILGSPHTMGDTDKHVAKVVQEKTEDVDVGDTGLKLWELLRQAVLWNCTAYITDNDGKNPDITDPLVYKGNVTEVGLLKFFEIVDGDAISGVHSFMQSCSDQIIDKIPFSSDRKRGSIIVKTAEGGVRIYCKGAPDLVLRDTTHVVQNGSIVPIDDEAESGDTHREIFEQTLKDFAAQAYRNLLITYRDMTMDDYERLKAIPENNNFEMPDDRACLEKELTAIALFGLQDPLRHNINDSVQKCREAGIQTIMCTGDNIDTAIAISKNAGIVTEEEIKANPEFTCMTGKQFREEVGGFKTFKNIETQVEQKIVKDMKKFRKVKEHLRVLARSSPADKLLLVTGIQNSDSVVAVTGDGSNDAPALKKADVGFAMGIAGTDIAKGACDIILLTDDFSCILVALRYGRNVFDNVRKFIQFQLTVNVVAMFIVFFGSVVLKDTPLNAVQMLWVNLIMDTFAALALATEPPAHDIHTRKPYPKDEPITTPIMWRNILGHAYYQIAVLLVVIFCGEGWLVQEYSRSCITMSETETFSDADGNIHKACKKYNPYFTKQLYVNADYTSWWSDQFNVTNPVATVGNFDMDRYKEWNCQSNVLDKTGDETTSPFTCTQDHTSTDYGNSNFRFPQNEPEGSPTQKLLHYTMTFQIFVFMQLFNQINARKIESGEYNVFSGMFDNLMFVAVLVVTIVVQMSMVELSGQTAKCYPLNMSQNLWALLFGSIEIPFALLLKQAPLAWFQCIKMNEKASGEDDGDNDGKPSWKDVLKKNTSFKRRIEKNTAKDKKEVADMKKALMRGFKDRVDKEIEKNEREAAQGSGGMNTAINE